MKWLVGFILLVQCSIVQSGEIYKANNTTALDQTGSWTGGTVPGASDTAVYTGLGALSTALGSDLSWQGIVATNNTGLWTISGANTLTLGSGGITTGDGTSGGVKVFAPLVLSASATYDAPPGRNITLIGALGGSGSLTKAGSGGMTLNADNSSYSGIITNAAGVIAAGSDTALGTGMMVMNGGMINAGGTDRTLANDLEVIADSRLEAVNANRNLTLTGEITGGAADELTLRGTGAITLSGDNTFSGGINIGDSSVTTLIAGHNNALGTGALRVDGNGGMFSVMGNLALANAINLDANLDVISASVMTLSGSISGSGSLIKSGSGNLVLRGDNAGFAGGISHSAGVLSIGHDDGMGTGILTMSDGKLNAYSTDRTLANPIVLAGDSIFETVNTSRDLTLIGEISGSGAATKTGSGTLTLTGANTYTNTTTVSVGELIVDGSLASSEITAEAGTGFGGSGSVQSVTMLSGSTLGVEGGADALTFNGDAEFHSGSTVILEIPATGSHDLLQGNGANTLDVSTDFIFDFSGNTNVAADDSFTVLQNWGAVVDGGLTYSAMGLPDGLSVDASQLVIDGSVTVVTSEVSVITRAIGLLYAGFYTGTEGPSGIYTFTDPTHPFETATRVGPVASPATTYQGAGYDGETYITLHRSNGKLYENNGSSVSFTLISGSYSYVEWHGVDRCNDVYYGIYDGSSLEGPGLYLFADPSDPENTGVKVCTNQTFSSDTWTDVAFDGERYLFVRTDAGGGTPGIYQYDPETDQFSPISGAETYADWEGLAVFDSDIAPLLNKKVYLLLFGGQSNALGWGYHQYLMDNNSPLQLPQDDIDFLYRKPYGSAGMLPENTLLPLQSGNSNTQVKQPGEYPALTNAPISRFGPEMSFARTVRDRISIPNTRVAVMKFASGGSGLYTIDQWWPDGTADRSADGTLYQKFQQVVLSTVAALKNKYPTYEVEVLGMGWVQGESDAMNGAAADYEENLTRFIEDIRVTFGTNITFTLSKLSSNQKTDDTWATVKAAQDAVAAADANVVATSTEGTNYLTSVGLSEGYLHFKTPSLLQIGEDLGNALIDASGLDSDEDGLPDNWEILYFDDLETSDGTGDSDGDGVSDQNEYLLGTDPDDSADQLKLSINSSLSGSWQAKKDVRYQMMKSTNLVSWISVGSPVLLRTADDTAEFDFSMYIPSAENKGFFRLSGD